MSNLGGEKRRRKIQELSRRDDFIDDVNKFRKRFGIPAKGYRYKEATADNVNHKIEMRILANKYSKKDINILQQKYKISEVNRGMFIDLLLFSSVGLSKRNFDILRQNLPLKIDNEYGRANIGERLIVGKRRLLLSINGTTKPDDIKDNFGEIEKEDIRKLPTSKEPFKVIKKNGEVCIEIFKNTKAYHFNKKSWDELVVPKQKKLPDFDPAPFREFINNDRDRAIIELLEEGNGLRAFNEAGFKEARGEKLTEVERLILQVNDYNYLYKIRARVRKKEK